MGTEIKTANRAKLERLARASNARRAAARKAYRAKIKSLLAEFGDEPLALVWQRVCPLDFDCEFPDRSGIINDLVDFAEVLKPSLRGMNAHHLCRLIEKYAADGSCQSGPSVSLLA